MTHFRTRPGTKTATHLLKKPFAEVTAFDAVIRSFINKNPLACTSYQKAGKLHPPVKTVRERYTAKFEYMDEEKKQIGTGSDTYNSVDGYQMGIAAITANMANLYAHRGKLRHLADSDLFSAILKCYDPNGELYFVSLARNRVTLSNYEDDAIHDRFMAWIADTAALA